jgi:hypothetical protein
LANRAVWETAAAADTEAEVEGLAAGLRAEAVLAAEAGAGAVQAEDGKKVRADI